MRGQCVKIYEGVGVVTLGLTSKNLAHLYFGGPLNLVSSIDGSWMISRSHEFMSYI